MRFKHFSIALITIFTLLFSVNSCTTVATSGVGLSIIKSILVGGISKGMAMVKDQDAFVNSSLIDQALPSQLRTINSKLESLGLGNLVTKEKTYIAQAAAYSANIAEPILINGVNSLTTDDAKRIATGSSGIATQILREKTQSQLIAAIVPKVDQKLNEFGIINTLNTALKSSNLLGSLLGNQSVTSGNISQLASEQIVNGLFNIIENNEKNNALKINQILGK